MGVQVPKRQKEHLLGGFWEKYHLGFVSCLYLYSTRGGGNKKDLGLSIWVWASNRTRSRTPGHPCFPQAGQRQKLLPTGAALVSYSVS